MTIGFDDTSYTVNESDGEVSVSVGVLTGDLSRDIIIGFNTVDVSATSTSK